MLGGNETEKKNFHSSKSPLAMNDIDINEIVMYDGYAYGKNKKYSLPFLKYCDGKNNTFLFLMKKYPTKSLIIYT